MRNSFNFYALIYKSIAFLACAILLLFFTKSRANSINNSYGNTIIYFSQAAKGNINVQIKADKIKNVELYIFTAGGELVEKLETDTKSIHTLLRVEKGEYLYQCFEKDNQLKIGKLNVNKNSLNYD